MQESLETAVRTSGSVGPRPSLAEEIQGRYGGSSGVIRLPSARAVVERMTGWEKAALPLLGDVRKRWTSTERGGLSGVPTLVFEAGSSVKPPAPPSRSGMGNAAIAGQAQPGTAAIPAPVGANLLRAGSTVSDTARLKTTQQRPRPPEARDEQLQIQHVSATPAAGAIARGDKGLAREAFPATQAQVTPDPLGPDIAGALVVARPSSAARMTGLSVALGPGTLRRKPGAATSGVAPAATGRAARLPETPQTILQRKEVIRDGGEGVPAARQMSRSSTGTPGQPKASAPMPLPITSRRLDAGSSPAGLLPSRTRAAPGPGVTTPGPETAPAASGEHATGGTAGGVLPPPQMPFADAHRASIVAPAAVGGAARLPEASPTILQRKETARDGDEGVSTTGQVPISSGGAAGNGRQPPVASHLPGPSAQMPLRPGAGLLGSGSWPVGPLPSLARPGAREATFSPTVVQAAKGEHTAGATGGSSILPQAPFGTVSRAPIAETVAPARVQSGGDGSLPMVRIGRAVGEQMQSAARPAGGDTSPVTAGGPASVPEPSTAPSGTEAAAQPPLDIERLADQVYTIIERRLRFEQESLGL